LEKATRQGGCRQITERNNLRWRNIASSMLAAVVDAPTRGPGQTGENTTARSRSSPRAAGRVRCLRFKSVSLGKVVPGFKYPLAPGELGHEGWGWIDALGAEREPVLKSVTAWPCSLTAPYAEYGRCQRRGHHHPMSPVAPAKSSIKKSTARLSSARAQARVSWRGLDWKASDGSNCAESASRRLRWLQILRPRPAAAGPHRNIPGAVQVGSLAELLEAGVDGVVIATPSAQHAEQGFGRVGTRSGCVFARKPLGRDENETRRIITAAREADCLLGVDLSYRFLSAVGKDSRADPPGGVG